MADADGKMRIEECGWKKNADNKESKKKKTRNADGKKKKVIKHKKRKEIFLSSSCHIVGPLASLTYRT